MRYLLGPALLLLLASCAHRLCLDAPPAPHSRPSRAAIAPGVYHLQLIATGGSLSRHSVEGPLVLAILSTSSTFDPSVELYGWFQGDLDVVAAPTCPDAEPLASSQDPAKPGVLLRRDLDGTLYLTVANASNLDRPEVMAVDGCGIALYVDSVTPAGFEGRWGAYGIVYDGCGSFRATKASTNGGA